MTHYETLGVARDASHEQIRTAYKRLAQKFHPDRRKDDVGADRRMKEINAAYAIVANAERRTAYDLGLARQEAFERERAAERASQASGGQSQSKTQQESARAQQGQSQRPNSANRNDGQNQHSEDTKHNKRKHPDDRAGATEQPTDARSERAKTRTAPPPVPEKSKSRPAPPPLPANKGSNFTARERGMLFVTCACLAATLSFIFASLFDKPPIATVGTEPERPSLLASPVKSADAEAESIDDLMIRALRLHGRQSSDVVDGDGEFRILGKLIGMGAISAAPIVRSGYTSYYFPQGVSYRGITLFGQSVVLIEFEYMGHEGFLGCCVESGYAVVLDVTDDIRELNDFAQTANCELSNYGARWRPEPITKWLTENVKRPIDDLVVLECSGDKKYAPSQLSNR